MVMMLLYLLHVIHGLNTDKQVHVYTDPGENVTLNCSFTTGDLQWTFHESCSNKSVTISDKREINPRHSYRIQNNYELADDKTYNLKIKNMSKCMEGKYVCCKTNGTVSKCMSYFDLQLKVPPSKVRVLNMTEDNSVIGIENKILILACYASGAIPIGKTTWYHGEKKLTMNEIHSEWANYSFTPNSKHNDKIFTCQAEHDMLRNPLNKSITLNILYHPRVQCLWPKGPVSVGQNVNVSCSYYSNPLDAEISWTKNGQTVDYSHAIVTNIVGKSERNLTEIDIITEDMQRVTSIMFENMTKEDAGAYTCNVTNTEGSASETVYLVVQDIYSEKEITDDINKIPAILIYIVVCCCGLIIFVSSAQIYTCWKSGKLRRVFSKTRTFQTVTSGETVHLDSFHTVENVSEINTAHYMEIEF